MQPILELTTDELTAIRLERMTSLDDTNRITANLDGDGDMMKLPSPAEMIATGIEQWENGGYDEITQTPYVAASNEVKTPTFDQVLG
jgi:hypothetical protein